MQELEIKVYGRVQGVNFRQSIRKAALNKGITGRVLNRQDGTVEIIAQGPKGTLQEFLFWVQKSPGMSQVKGLNYRWQVQAEAIPEFTIVRDSNILIDKAKGVVNLGKNLFKKSKPVVPQHIAIIPDGNRRWARAKGLAPQVGHYTSASFQHLKELFTAARDQGAKYMTLWGFSTENWKRNPIEVKAIFDLIEKNLDAFREEAHLTKIRFRHIGRKDRLPRSLIQSFDKLEQETKHYTNFNVQLCLDYGGRDELARAIKKIIAEKPSLVNEQLIQNHLDSRDIPDIDLIVRTSGEQRLSGFMPFQSVYAELYFTELHFPDFTSSELKKAITEYGNRQRRFGG